MAIKKEITSLVRRTCHVMAVRCMHVTAETKMVHYVNCLLFLTTYLTTNHALPDFTIATEPTFPKPAFVSEAARDTIIVRSSRANLRDVSGLGSSISNTLGYFKIIKLGNNSDPDKVIKRLNAHSEVNYAVMDDYVFAATSRGLLQRDSPQVEELIPTDPGFQFQWGMSRVGAPSAWKQIQESEQEGKKKGKVLVCITDSGIDYNHPDLKANVHPLIGYNVLAEGDDLRPLDDLGHGTSIAGIAAAVGNNSLDIAGVSWEGIELLSCKFLNSQGVGRVSDAIVCIDYCLGLGADIITNSWSGAKENEAIKEAISIAGRRGVLFVSAAGNDGQNISETPTYPAAYSNELPNMIVVASMNIEDKLSEFSNYGVDTVDVAAPGEWILSTAPSNETKYYSGTSMAAPLIAATAAVLQSQSSSEKKLSPEKIKELILSSVEVLPSLEGKVGSGGVLRIDKALQELYEMEAQRYAIPNSEHGYFL